MVTTGVRPVKDRDTAVTDRDELPPSRALQLAFEHREVVHELLHAGAGRSGQLLGAALTCRAQVAAGCVVMKKRGASLPPEPTRF